MNIFQKKSGNSLGEIFTDIRNIYRIQAHNSIMCGFIDFVLKCKSLLELQICFLLTDMKTKRQNDIKIFSIESK